MRRRGFDMSLRVIAAATAFADGGRLLRPEEERR
jgi:hypothetical protein